MRRMISLDDDDELDLRASWVCIACFLVRLNAQIVCVERRFHGNANVQM